MESKVCKNCGIEKRCDQYHKDSYKKDGLQSKCKSCSSEWYINNKERILKKNKIKYEKDKEAILCKQKQYYQFNKELIANKGKVYRTKNKEKINTRRLLNQPQINLYSKQKYQIDILFRLRKLIRSRLKKSRIINRYKKSSATVQTIGCSYEELKIHLEETWAKNYPGISLDWNSVQVDHIVPLSSANSEEELIKLNHWTNLQLLTAEDNKAKSDKLDWSLPIKS